MELKSGLCVVATILLIALVYVKMQKVSTLVVAPDGTLMSSPVEGLISSGASLRFFGRRTDGSGGDIPAGFLSDSNPPCNCANCSAGQNSTAMPKSMTEGMTGNKTLGKAGFASRNGADISPSLERALRGL
jgi:hypothetical protein